MNSVFFSEYIHKIYGAPTVVLWEKAPIRVSAVETGQVAFVRANLWQPVCAIDGGMSAVFAPVNPRERKRRIVVVVSFPIAPSRQSAALFKETRGEGASEKPRIMIDILTNAGGKIRYL